MKTAIIFTIFASCTVFVLADNVALFQQCVTETQVSEADVKDWWAGGMQNNAKENLKCYTKCLMEKQGHMSNGVFNAPATIDTLKNFPQLKDSQAEVVAAVEACKNFKGSNDCDTAFKISTCLKDHNAVPQH